MTITIKTRLNSGIYKSSGGGETRTHYEWATGPRNLMAALDTFFEHIESMERSYGNIGCGKSWMEIDGIRVTIDNDLMEGDDPKDFRDVYSFRQPKSRTQKCREFIEYVRSGEYQKDKAAVEAWYESEEGRKYLSAEDLED